MYRWLALVSAFLLVLSFGMGTMAHAAQASECVPTSSQYLGHAEPSRGEAPSGSQKSIGHHHSNCSGHQVCAPAEAADVRLSTPTMVRLAPSSQFRLPTRAPDNLLRPPIA